MATNKTTNYQLNQWAKTDRIMMDDFNSDNAKLDAALAGKRESSRLLLSAVVNEEGQNTIDLDLSAIEWDKWEQITVLSQVQTRIGYNTDSVGLSLDGAGWNTLAALSPIKFMELHLFPRRNKSGTIHGLFFPGGTVHLGNGTYESLTKLSVYTRGDYIKVGSSVTVWGE